MTGLRKMRTADAFAVAELERRVFSRPWSERGFCDALNRSDTVFLVAEDADGVAGYIGMYEAAGEGEITNVAVAPEKRRAGVGYALLNRLLKIARERGIARIVLEVRVSNADAVRLYERCGFTRCGVRKNFYDFPREDAYLMEKSLESEGKGEISC